MANTVGWVSMAIMATLIDDQLPSIALVVMCVCVRGCVDVHRQQAERQSSFPLCVCVCVSHLTDRSLISRLPARSFPLTYILGCGSIGAWEHEK